MSELIDIVCVRVIGAVEEYAHTGVLPDLLINHSITMDDVEQCFDQLDRLQQHQAVRMIKHYVDHTRENLADLKEKLRADYNHTLENLQTLNSDFQFPTVLSRYRAHINPVTALYYDAREMIRAYNCEDERHVWLHGLLSDRKFNNQILDALSADMKMLEKIVREYQWPMRKLDTGVPLQLFHAKQMISEFSQHYVLFASLPSWDPEEE